VTDWLPQYPINTKDVIEDRVEHYKWDIELFFVELLQSSFNVMLEFFLADRHIVFVKVVGEVDGAN